MNIDDYPPQEPLSAPGLAYQTDVMRGYPDKASLASIEASYGEDPYQRLLVFPCARPNGSVLLGLPTSSAY